VERPDEGSYIKQSMERVDMGAREHLCEDREEWKRFAIW
jgi:hypothetical protein